MLISLGVHALLLSLAFGGQANGLPGLAWPWQERRFEAPDLNIVLTPAPVDAEPAADASVGEPPPLMSIGRTVAAGAELTSPGPAAPTPDRSAAAIVPTAEARAVTPAPAAATAAVAPPPLPTGGSVDAVPAPAPGSDVISTERTDKARWAVPAAASAPAPTLAAASSASSPQGSVSPPDSEAMREHLDPDLQQQALLSAERKEIERKEAQRQEAVRQAMSRQEAVRLEAARQEAARLDAARLEALRVETARLEAERKDLERQEAARQAVVRQEAIRQEAVRQEAIRQELVRQEASRQEALREEAARREAERADSARLEAERKETERQQASRQAAARQEAARVEAAQEAAARREAVLHSIGRQLDEEATRRDPASTAAGPPARLAPATSSARRGRLFGRSDPNAELILYAEAWARKIQLNMTFDLVRELAKQPHTDPLVTVAIRSDGSVESVTFVLSSGVAALDEAIRRVVQNQLPYPAFPPALAREFDVIELRRTWHFDTAIRLF